MNTPATRRAVKKRPALVTLASFPDDVIAKEEAILLLKNSCTEQIESIQLMMDAAVLAVEQVQDKRLEFLEEGPEVTALDIFLEFALTFIIEEKLVGRFVSGLAKDALSRRLQQKLLTEAIIKRAASKSFFRSAAQSVIAPGGARATWLLDAAAAKAMRASGVVLQSVQELANSEPERAVAEKTLQSLNRWIKALTFLTDESKGGVEGLWKASKAAYVKSEVGRGTQPYVARPGAWDTPGVSVLDQVQQYVMAHRASVRAEASYLEMLLRADVMPPNEFVEMKYLAPQPLYVDGRVVTHDEAKNAWKRHFEALIWTLIVKEKPMLQPLIAGHEKRDWKTRFLFMKDHVPGRVRSYWLRRFINPDNDKPFSELGPIQNPYGGAKTIEQAEPAMIKYMTRIGEEAEKGGVRLLVGEALKARPDPDEKPKQ